VPSLGLLAPACPPSSYVNHLYTCANIALTSTPPYTPTIMTDAEIEAKIDNLFMFGADQLDRNEVRQLLAVRGRSCALWWRMQETF